MSSRAGGIFRPPADRYTGGVKILKSRSVAPPVPCPYLEDRTFVQEYFYAYDLSPGDYGDLLRQGWRRFGFFFFRPACPECRACIPLRVHTGDFRPTKSQKRAARRNRETSFRVTEPTWTEAAWRIYRRHSELKFGRTPVEEDFRSTFFTPAVPAFQTHYYLDGQAAGIGFLDGADDGLSSVYFAYDPDVERRSLGTWSIMREIELAGDMGLTWYYLGYWIADCSRMAYQGRFGPHQILDWETGAWRSVSPGVLENEIGGIEPQEDTAVPFPEHPAASGGSEQAE